MKDKKKEDKSWLLTREGALKYMKEQSEKPPRTHIPEPEEVIDCDHVWVGNGYNCGGCGVDHIAWMVYERDQKEQVLHPLYNREPPETESKGKKSKDWMSKGGLY